MTARIPTRNIGLDKLTVGAVGLGAMSFGNYHNPLAYYDKDAVATAILDRAEQLGVTLIDTADVYGPSEEIVGRALKGRRTEFVVATKFGIVPIRCENAASKLRSCPSHANLASRSSRTAR